MTPQFRILGPLEAHAGGRPVDLGGPTRRRLLAVLLLHAGDVVSVDRLLDAVWEHEPPPRAETTLRAHVSKLRRGLAGVGGGELLVTRSPGYSLQVAAEQVDAPRFERLVADGRAALDEGEPTRAADMLRTALALWRGEVLEDLGRPRFAEAEAARLDELRLVALEARIDADLALGRHREAAGELEALVAAHPLREQLCGQLMLALYRSGRQSDALEAYRRMRQRLDEQLGLAPGPALAELETAILRHDPTLAPRVAASAPGTLDRDDRVLRPRGRPDALLDVVRRVPLVGRTSELATLRRLWAAVVDGERRVALLSGEAGVGKTRLVAEVAAAGGDGAVVLVGRCEPEALAPYQPVSEALRDSGAAADALVKLPGPLREQLGALLDTADGSHRDASWLDDAERQRSALFDAVVHLFAQVTTAGPVLFVVDEAEHLDRASAHVLGHLARRLPERMLLAVCFRDPPGSRQPALRELLADLEGRGLADRLELRPLPERDLGGLVAAWTGTEPSADFTHTLWSSTGGNPFYAIEVIRDLAARGAIGSTADAWRVPAGVRDVLRERLRALSRPTQEIIGCAAVLGSQIDIGVLAAVAEQPDDSVAAGLEEALAAGWVAETGRPWGPSYAFRHALMREAVRADIPAPRRQRLHLRAAEALEAAGSRRASDVAAAAAHLRAAGPLADPQRTADLSLRAAEQAAAVYAWNEAVAHAEAAVATLDSAGGPPSLRARAATAAADMLIRSNIDLDRAIEHLETALSLHQAAGDRAAVARVHSRLGFVLSFHVLDIPRALEHLAAAEPVLTEGVAGFDVQVGTALAASYGLRIDQTRAASQRALELAGQLDQPELVGWAQLMQVCPAFSTGDLAAAHRLTEQAWTTARDLDEPHLGWDAVLTGALMDTMLLLDPVAGRAWCRRGLVHPRLRTIPHAQRAITDKHAYALASMGALNAAREAAAGLPQDTVSRRLLLTLDGDWEAAARSFHAALDHDLARGDLVHAILNACWLGQVRFLLGAAADATAVLHQALSISLDAGVDFGELMARADLARVLVMTGAVDEAAEHLASCDSILARGEDWRGRAGKVELARGGIAAAREEHDVADRAYGRALDAFTTYRLPWWRGETLVAWARALERAGRPADAEVQRAAARQQYAALGAQDRWLDPLASRSTV